MKKITLHKEHNTDFERGRAWVRTCGGLGFQYTLLWGWREGRSWKPEQEEEHKSLRNFPTSGVFIMCLLLISEAELRKAMLAGSLSGIDLWHVRWQSRLRRLYGYYKLFIHIKISICWFHTCENYGVARVHDLIMINLEKRVGPISDSLVSCVKIFPFPLLDIWASHLLIEGVLC